MRPVAVLNAIIFGSATAITFGLTGVLIIYLILKGRHPQLASEFGLLLRSSGQFAVLAAVSGVSLFAMLKRLQWRWIAQTAMWFTATVMVVAYWPQ